MYERSHTNSGIVIMRDIFCRLGCLASKAQRIRPTLKTVIPARIAIPIALVMRSMKYPLAYAVNCLFDVRLNHDT